MFVILVLGLLFVLYLYNRFSYKRGEAKFPPTGKFVRVNGIPLHYMDRGEGRPIVFLHGGVLRGNDFHKAMDLGVSKGYRTLSFDRPGYGYSGRPRSVKDPFTLIDHARLLHLALKEIGVENPILVGHSWSGLLVLVYASLYPDQLAGLVTVAGGMYKEGYPAEKGDPISRIITTPIIGNLIMNTLLVPLGRIMVWGIIKVTFAPERVPADYAEEIFAFWLRPSQFRANREDVLQFVPAAVHMENQFTQIKTPTVIVVGELDPFPTKEHSYRLHRELSNAKLIVLPESAHMIPHTQPDEVINAVDALIEKFQI